MIIDGNGNHIPPKKAKELGYPVIETKTAEERARMAAFIEERMEFFAALTEQPPIEDIEKQGGNDD